ncbi:hypothetical protein JTB14_027541 [Gonioctena quinquepunctata]|nr:hypothetical protein JTB14_027541 [Gonioctena quinquepunctata]
MDAIHTVGSICDSESVASISQYDPTITPRKQRLLTKLRDTVRISRDRKIKLASMRKTLSRREKKIANMKDILEELRKKKFIKE